MESKVNFTKRKEILACAENLVCEERDRQYGNPKDNFEEIGMFWGTYLWHKYNLGNPQNAVGKNFISAEDVSAMMVLLKVARICTGKSKEDNWIDIAGYAACGAEIGGNDHENQT